MIWLHYQSIIFSEGSKNKQAETLTWTEEDEGLTPFLPPPVTYRYFVVHSSGIFMFAGEHADLQNPIPATGLLVSVD